MTVGTDASGAAAPPPGPREWTFSVTPPRGRGTDRQDTKVIPARMLVSGRFAYFDVGGVRVAQTGRAALLAWLIRGDVRANYIDLPLRLRRYGQQDAWFELSEYTAPMMLTSTAIRRMVRLLGSS